MSEGFRKVRKLYLKNFTVFEEAEFEFSPGINVLVGANSTGKTHLMKIMYALPKMSSMDFSKKMPRFFNQKDANQLIRNPEGNTESAYVRLGSGNKHLHFEIDPHKNSINFGSEFVVGMAGRIEIQPSYGIPFRMFYLPSQEFLSIHERFLSLSIYSEFELPYDETCFDLSLALSALPLPPERLTDVREPIKLLENIIAGDHDVKEIITQQNGRFYFHLPEGKFDVHLIGDGYRKLGTLLYLLKNGSVTKDSILFWDDPTANLNPDMISGVVGVLRSLAMTGMQIFVATHDYLLGHELSYPSDSMTDIRFFGLRRPDRMSGVLTESARTFSEIKHNPIIEKFAAHHERESEFFFRSAEGKG